MTQLDLTYTPRLPDSRKFDGQTFEPKKDAERLGKQLEHVRDYMVTVSRSMDWRANDGWRTLREISVVLGFPESSISARLRDLRKLKFGAYTVERRRLSGGVWEYRVSK